ncbi:hypothetical protein HDV57DRAFT_303196 [Trichoderma longibrachiatum]
MLTAFVGPLCMWIAVIVCLWVTSHSTPSPSEGDDVETTRSRGSCPILIRPAPSASRRHGTAKQSCLGVVHPVLPTYRPCSLLRTQKRGLTGEKGDDALGRYVSPAALWCCTARGASKVSGRGPDNGRGRVASNGLSSSRSGVDSVCISCWLAVRGHE